MYKVKSFYFMLKSRNKKMIEKISCGFVYLHLSDQVNATDAV